MILFQIGESEELTGAPNFSSGLKTFYLVIFLGRLSHKSNDFPWGGEYTWRNAYGVHMLMARISSVAVLLAGLLAPVTANGQSGVPPPTRSETLQIELTSTIRANKAKVGDAVKARTVSALILPNQTVVPEGSKLIGHVCATNSGRSDTNPAVIGIAFDEVQVKNGAKLRLHFSIRAGALVHATVHEAVASQNELEQTSAPSDSRHHPAAGVLQRTSKPVDPPSQPESFSQPQIELRSLPGGTLIGMPGVSLRVDGPAGAATFQSSNRKLELKSGLQLMLRVDP
jgi:hypothetical protein